jgi:hypothetical protein
MFFNGARVMLPKISQPQNSQVACYLNNMNSTFNFLVIEKFLAKLTGQEKDDLLIQVTA